MKQLQDNPFDLSLWNRIENIVNSLKMLNFNLVLWEAQNIYFQIGKAHVIDAAKRSGAGDTAAKEWIEHTITLGNYLGVKVL